MQKDREIAALYKVLALYESITDPNTTTTEGMYRSYVDRQYVYWLGVGNADIYETLKGLFEIGASAGHSRVKSLVFHMIAIVKQGYENEL